MIAKIRPVDKVIISSRKNPLVRRLRLISTKAGREKHQMLLLEGTHLLEEALHTDYFPKEIIATTSWLEKYSHILQLLQSGTQIIEVTQSVLETSLTTVNPDGVASLFPLSRLPLPPPDPKFILALDRIQDPGNLGNIFRTALAADVDLIWLASGADPLNQKVIRSSVGAILKMPYERLGSNETESIEYLVKELNLAADRGFQIVATSSKNNNEYNSIPYWDIDWNKPTVLLLGNEGSGLHPSIQECSSCFARLPHSDSIESLNVAAVAVPILLERRRVKMTKGM